MNEINTSVVNGDYYYINRSTGYESNNHNYIYYTNNRNEISTNRYLMENNGLMDGVGINDMLHASVINQYVNLEYNNKHHSLQSNGNISTSSNLSV